MSKTKIITSACAIVGIVAIVVGLLLSSGSKAYKVTFDTDGGSSIVMQEVKQNEKATKPATPTKDGYTFVRWEYQEKEYDFTSAITNDITLKAIWEKNEEQEIKYKITFNVEEMSKTIEVSNANEIDISSLGFNEKSGYILKWYVDNKEYDLNSTITDDMTIVGKYEKVSTFTVKFNSNGGTSVKNQTLKSGEKVTEPSNITKYGYIFDGWYLNNKKYDFNSEVTKNITLVAKWTDDPDIKRYTVTYDSDGGSIVSSQKVIENTTTSQPKNPTKSGYAFVEWQLNGEKYDFKTKITKDITLKAVWKESVSYTLKIEKIDNYSPARIIKVFKNGSQITVKSIKAGSDGVILCSGSNPTVDNSDIENEKSLIVVLSDGKEVRINVQ